MATVSSRFRLEKFGRQNLKRLEITELNLPESKLPESNRRPFEFYIKRSDRCSHVRHSPEKILERVIGFEPMICGFADRRLCPLGYARQWIFDFGFGTEVFKSQIRNRNSQI